MGTALIPTTITAMLGKVCLFEADCVAEIEYEIEDGECGSWHIRDFRFDAETHVWDEAKGGFSRKVVGTVWCPDYLRPALIEHADKNHIEEKLYEKLREDGELGYANAGLRSDYHAGVL
jgi:hypothetical protein